MKSKQLPTSVPNGKINKVSTNQNNPISASITSVVCTGAEKDVVRDSTSEPWSVVVGRRRPKQQPIVGSNSSTDTYSKIKGVPKTVSLHVYRLNPPTEVEDVIDFIKSTFPEVTCEKLNSRNPDSYSSFKVDIFEEHLISASDPELWPKNACVRRFFQSRKKISAYSIQRASCWVIENFMPQCTVNQE